MAGSVNKAIIIGHLGRDPDIRTTPSGDIIAALSVATSESWRDKNTGDRHERTEWHRVTIFNQNIAKVAQQYLKKGAKIYLEGQIETRKWTDQKTGQDKYTTEIVLRPYRGELTMLDTRGAGGPPPASSPDDYGRPSSRHDPGGGTFHPQSPAPSDGLEDEIPF